LTPRVLLINGSPAGRQGNTASVLERMAACLRERAVVDSLILDSLVLAESHDPLVWEARIRASEAFVFATGTYWDSWGSPLQRFLESLTSIEASDAWLGKPAAVLVTMHSVGGKGVLSRLQGVLNTLGLLLPPLTGWVFSAASQTAISGVEHRAEGESHWPTPRDRAVTDDLWRLDDLTIVAHNLLEALYRTHRWQAWPVDRAHFQDRWVEPTLCDAMPGATVPTPGGFQLPLDPPRDRRDDSLPA
jgi:chromate reductase